MAGKPRVGTSKHPRSHFSLSGASYYLLGLGGGNERDLNNCEIYCLITNKWKVFSNLKTRRKASGSLILSSMKALSFCGFIEVDSILNSIKTIKIDTEEKWKTLPLQDKIAMTGHLAAV